MRLSFVLVFLLCLFTVGGLPPTDPPPAEAHTIKCKAKRGQSKCAKRAARHSRAHRIARSVACRPKRKCSWRAPGVAPLSDGEATSRVRPVGEIRPDNADENAYRPSAGELKAFRTGQVDRYGRTQLEANPLSAYVTGGFSGTTDEILQWVAHKWSIPEDIVRAVAVRESSWRMSALGDRHAVSDPRRYPAQSRIAGTRDVYQSLGIMQIKWTPEGLHQGTEPLRWKSTAFNADYWGAMVRYYYDGLCYWCRPHYSAGQKWASIGAWYSPSLWATSSTAYVQSAKTHTTQRPWTQPGF